VEQKGGSRNSFISFAAVEFHEDFGGGTGHTSFLLTCVDIVPTGEEVCIQAGVVKECLYNDGLVAGLPHVPYTTSATSGAWVLVGIVFYIDFGCRVLSPNRVALCQKLVDIQASQETSN
jgi:hypothetical protein